MKNIVMRALFLIFGAVVASAGFVVSCVLYRDHAKYSFVQVWLAIAAVVIIFTVGVMWFVIGLKGEIHTPETKEEEA
jgi:hypothetical protein